MWNVEVYTAVMWKAMKNTVNAISVYKRIMYHCNVKSDGQISNASAMQHLSMQFCVNFDGKIHESQLCILSKHALLNGMWKTLEKIVSVHNM